MADADVASPLDLIGEWTLTRTIDDRLAETTSTVDGTTELTLLDDGRVRWSEAGTLHQPSGPVPVSRTLFVEPRDDGWFVTFDDGRDFHPWDPGHQVVHPCSPDTYVGLVEPGPDQCLITWQVSGPAKDYTMVSTLTR